MKYYVQTKSLYTDMETNPLFITEWKINKLWNNVYLVVYVCLKNDILFTCIEHDPEI